MNGYDHETYNLEKEKSLWPDKDFLRGPWAGVGLKTIHIHSFFSEHLKIQKVALIS